MPPGGRNFFFITDRVETISTVALKVLPAEARSNGSNPTAGQHSTSYPGCRPGAGPKNSDRNHLLEELDQQQGDLTMNCLNTEM